MNRLYYGDNLDVMREHLADESVDLVYLDPPFNSKAQYNLLFKTPAGEAAEAQAEAFQDTWHWSEFAEAAYTDVITSKTSAGGILRSLRGFLGESDMMAYLAMMGARLVEMHRVLAPTGCLYLHCDPTASHYLKIVLDGIFGPGCFRSEIIWKRTSAHSGAKRYGPVHDTILFYSKGPEFTWNVQYSDYDPEYIKAFFTHVDDLGRRWRRTDLTGPGIRQGDSGLPWRHYDPTERGRHWQPPSYFYDKYKELADDDLANYPLIERLEKLDALGLVHWPKKVDGMPQGKRLLEDAPGLPLQDMWTDIKPIHNISKERLGYPTQKPQTLLERIIVASSNPGDTVLDPFCGCGTTIHAAEGLGRRWAGIDVTHYAVTLVENRVQAAFPKAEFDVHGRPLDLESARDLARRDKYQFQWWANWLVGVQNYREHKKGADRGIDGIIYFRNGPYGTGQILVSVKAGDNVGVSMMRDFRGTVEREDAELGLFVTLAPPTQNMRSEAASAGFVQTAHGRFPRIQISTVEDLLHGLKPELPQPYEVLPIERHGRRKVAARADDQMSFTFSIQGKKKAGKARAGEVIYIDPRAMPVDGVG